MNFLNTAYFSWVNTSNATKLINIYHTLSEYVKRETVQSVKEEEERSKKVVSTTSPCKVWFFFLGYFFWKFFTTKKYISSWRKRCLLVCFEDHAQSIFWLGSAKTRSFIFDSSASKPKKTKKKVCWLSCLALLVNVYHNNGIKKSGAWQRPKRVVGSRKKNYSVSFFLFFCIILFHTHHHNNIMHLKKGETGAY